MRHVLLALLAACSSSPTHAPDGAPVDSGPADARPDTTLADVAPGQRTVIVIPLENKDDVEIIGNPTDAPYINGLLATAAYTTNFQDELPISIPSEPHYVWMEAGTNAFADHTFTTDNDPSASNLTADTAHLSTQLDAAGIGWTSYQEGITSGTCPIASTGFYAAKHDPFVFFADVVGSPPSAAANPCAAHHESLADLAGDLAGDALPPYTYITPNLCHDMHGALGCPSGLGSSANIQAGDQWLAANLPPLIAYTHTHDAVIFLTWDEGDATRLIPFVAIGDHVVAGPNASAYSHSSQLATIEELLGVPVLPRVATAPDLAPLFAPGYL
ncbi:MAG TPA: alkaline phosphatase family protein [Kofleriaceae bacterium]|jgi:hypothetical protein